jgi:hypothetical protein
MSITKSISQTSIKDQTTGDTANVVLRGDGKQALAVDTSGTVIESILGRSQVYDFIHSAAWMRQAIYDDVSISVGGSVATLTYKEDSGIIGKAIVDFTDQDNWTLNLERYITEEDNNPLEDDDDTELFLD